MILRAFDNEKEKHRIDVNQIHIINIPYKFVFTNIEMDHNNCITLILTKYTKDKLFLWSSCFGG